MQPEMQKKFWDREQIKRISAGFDTNKRRLGLIFSHIQKSSQQNPSSTRILNIGIGNGYLEAVLLEAGFDVYSLDPSETAVSALIEKLGISQSNCLVGTVDAIPFEDNFFDYVVMSEVIEHLTDTSLTVCMHELLRILNTSGTFLGTCPDDENLSRNTVTCPNCNETFHRVGHMRSFTVKSLNTFLSRFFQVQVCKSVRGMHLNWKGLLIYWYNVFPFRLARLFKPSIHIPQYLGCHIFFVASKNEK